MTALVQPDETAHVTYEAVRAALDAQPWAGGTRRVSARLTAGDLAWNSASTRHEVHGPTVVTYVEYVDGAIDTLVTD